MKPAWISYLSQLLNFQVIREPIPKPVLPVLNSSMTLGSKSPIIHLGAYLPSLVSENKVGKALHHHLSFYRMKFIHQTRYYVPNRKASKKHFQLAQWLGLRE